MNLSIRAVRDLDEFHLLEREWNDLETYTDRRNLAATFRYIYNWWLFFCDINDSGNFGYNKQLLILLLYNDDVRVAIVPLLKLYRKKFGLKIHFIEFMSQQWGSALVDIICKDLNFEQAEFIVKWLYANEKFCVLQLKYIPENSSLVKFYNKDVAIMSACPEQDLSQFPDYENYKGTIYSKSLNQNLRTARNKMAKAKLLYSEKIFTLIDNDLFKIIMNISRSKLRDGKESIYENHQMRDFYMSIFKVFPLSAVILYVNNIPVAYRINLFLGNIKMCIDASYDRDYKGLNLGAMSVDCSIRESFNKKIQIHNEGPGIDYYKIKFLKNLRGIFTLTKKGNSFKKGNSLLTIF